MDSPDDEFFIGYEAVPPGLGRRLFRVAWGLGAMAIGGAALLALGHLRLEGGTFSFGDPRPIAGALVAAPYPAVSLGPLHAALLVAPGKHAADINAAGGGVLGAQATRISRAGAVMMELVPESVRVAAATVDETAAPAVVAIHVELTGEIVDSKCFLGVMVPGDGVTHRECASLCVRGGIPPALFVRDRQGHSALLLLTGRSDDAIRARAVELAGTAVQISGRVTRRAGWLVLETDPAAWRQTVT